MNKKLIKVSNALSLTEFKHIFRVMKLASLFGTICVSSVFAVNVNSQSLRVSIHANQEQAKEVIKQIEEQTDYLFVYNHDKVNLNSTVTIQANNETVAKVLNQMFAGTDIIYAIQGNNILLMHKDAVMQQQQQSGKVVTGTIIDPSGMPVIGANVMEKGTTNGTITDMDGKFSLNVEKSATLVISYIGFSNQEIKIGNQTNLSITMKEDAEALDELVVVGYGVQKKESLTGALQVVSSEKLMDITTSDVTTMLSAKAPGVWVGSGGGQPGAEGNVLIRGKSTINGSTAPLWVVDGVIMGEDAGQLNPNDIESISVLKDAASTAIYGSKGANGVIMVTTRQAKAGKAVINANAKWAATNLVKGNMKMMNGSQLYDFFQQYTNQEAITFNGYNESLRDKNYDWWKNGSQTGFAQEYNISISGGSEKMKSYLSASLYDETGAVKGFDFRRYTLRYNMTYQVNDWLTLKPKFSAARRETDNCQHSLSAMYTNLPWDSPYDEEGNLIQQFIPTDWVAQDKYNYLYDLQWNYSKSTRHEASIDMDFDIRLTDWLTFASTNNYRYMADVLKDYTDPRSSGGESVNGIIRDRNNNTISIYTNQLLRFNKNFGNHMLNGVLAYEWNTRRYETADQSTQGFAPGFSVAAVGATPRTATGTLTEYAIQSLLFNANYSYSHKYLAQFSFRRDGASNFGVNAKYGNFFSISGGWNIHQEDFFDFDWIQQLKLRASYGSVGNRPMDNYPQYMLYKANLKYNANPGAMLSQLENKDLTWEKTYTAGIGLDVMLFDRLSLNLDLYSKKTTDLLYQVPIPGVVGVASLWQNVGKVTNKGVELSVAYDILNNKDLKWSASANIAKNRNKIAELYGNGDPITISNGGANIAGVLDKRMEVGHDLDSWYGAEWAGVDPQTGDPQWYYTTANGTREKTNNYSLAQTSKVMLGSMTPDFFGGFGTEFSIKNLTVSANFGYSVGGKIFSYNRTVYDSDGAYPTYNQQIMLDDWTRWQKPGDIATHPKLVYGNTSNSSKPSSRQLEDASFLRMRVLTVGYLLPWNIPHVNGIRINVSGENLFTITGFSGPDPEMINTADGRVGAFVNAYPQTRKFLLSLNVTL